MAIIHLKAEIDIQAMGIDDLVRLQAEINLELLRVAPVFDLDNIPVLKNKRKYIKKVPKAWTSQEIADLIERAERGMSAKDICILDQRHTISAVRHALNRCGYYATKRGARYTLRGATSDD